MYKNDVDNHYRRCYYFSKQRLLILERGTILPKDKKNLHIVILENAKKEFLEFGFEKASMRSIAGKSNVTAGALYKHFKSKEEMFNELVEPAYLRLLRVFNRYTDFVMDDIAENVDEIFDDSINGTMAVLRLIYDNFDEFQLMFNKSAGTRFERIREEIVDLETKSIKRFIETAKENGLNPADISDIEIHIFATMSLSPFFEVITHGYHFEEAVKIVELMSKAQNYAWEKIVSLKLK